MEKIQKAIKLIVKKIWKKYKVEFVLIVLSLLIAVISFIVFFNNQSSEKTENLIQETTRETKNTNQKVYVDIAGAVVKPDVYKLNFGARVKDVLNLAGGFSEEADKQFFVRNFNLARLVSDQEKIYVPSLQETANGLFVENRQTLTNLQPNSSPQPNSSTSNLININEASEQELDQLPGIGKTTANKIINNRPYTTIEELLNKKIINQSVFEKIKEMIEI
jgi:competence protein ComEA